ncbi:COL6A [Mytilus edulis]|uniref:COL6A n=1 Tax=Mytilus edulis TaxID=6550 RepID=A0A8S3V7M8_MYTED|nr:COL6A [Mytilus edulis]
MKSASLLFSDIKMFFFNIVKVFVILVAVEAHYYYKHKKSDEKPKCDTCDAVADIIFVYDKSGSIAVNQTNFVLMKQFMIDIVDSFNPVGATGTQFAALCFDHNPQTHFYLNENNNAPDPKQATIDAINTFLTDQNGGTNIGSALQEVRIEFLKTENGIGRPCAQCFVILITDGISGNNPDPVDEANMLRADNCIVYVVPIGLNTNSAQIEAIAGGPDNVFSVQNFDLFSTVVQGIVRAACNSSACSKFYDLMNIKIKISND